MGQTKPDVSAKTETYALSDFPAGTQILDANGEAVHIITDAPARSGFVKLCQQNTGAIREFLATAIVKKDRVRLYFVGIKG